TMPRQLPGVTWTTFVTRCGLPLCMMTFPTLICVAAITTGLLGLGGEWRGSVAPRGLPCTKCGGGLGRQAGEGGQGRRGGGGVGGLRRPCGMPQRPPSNLRRASRRVGRLVGGAASLGQSLVRPPLHRGAERRGDARERLLEVCLGRGVERRLARELGAHLR